MRPYLPAVLSLIAGLGLSGCASQAEAPRGAAYFDRSVAKGAAYAERVCHSCHARLEGEASPTPPAPPLAQFAARFDTPYALQAKLTDIAESGHYQMPATQPHANEIEDLAAYIGSLNSSRR